eukprot:489329_1
MTGSIQLQQKDVGIKAIEVYFPQLCVSQSSLEISENVSAGKYTAGLEQTRMSFADDREDIYSISLTVVSRLMRTYGLDYTQIGRLEVATETIQDHSKSVKSFLMKLFKDSGNSNVEGVDSLHACYAGTAALFNSVAWVQSPDWDGRLAMVVAADIAEYKRGPARPTGGCAAVAFIVGPDAPLILEPGRFSYMSHAFDFYKPHVDSPYPEVDGAYSNECYLSALDACVKGYSEKFQGRNFSEFRVFEDAQFAVFHSPYIKLVRKSLARLGYNDFLTHPESSSYSSVQKFKDMPHGESLTSRALMKAFVQLTGEHFARMVAPSTLLSSELGNSYTASVYCGILSLILDKGEELVDTRTLVFSYGSGLAASMFSLRGGSSDVQREQFKTIQRALANIRTRLEARVEVQPSDFHETLDRREKLYTSSTFVPESKISSLAPGTFYLTEKDAKGRRYYSCVTDS